MSSSTPTTASHPSPMRPASGRLCAPTTLACCSASRAMTSSVRSAVMIARIRYGSVELHVEQARRRDEGRNGYDRYEHDSKQRQQRDLNVDSWIKHGQQLRARGASNNASHVPLACCSDATIRARSATVLWRARADWPTTREQFLETDHNLPTGCCRSARPLSRIDRDGSARELQRRPASTHRRIRRTW